MQTLKLGEPTEQKFRRTDQPPIWVTVNEAVRLASIKRTRLYELLGDGTLKSIKIGGKRLIAYASIESLGQ
jgi:excisionase family DNA binding protein